MTNGMKHVSKRGGKLAEAWGPETQLLAHDEAKRQEEEHWKALIACS
jgi:hypothetical protein